MALKALVVAVIRIRLIKMVQKKVYSWYHADGRIPVGSTYRRSLRMPSFSLTLIELICMDSVLGINLHKIEE